MDESLLNDLCRKSEYLKEAPSWLLKFCPDQESLNWFVKDNRGELSDLGAIARIGRDHFIVKSRFPAAVRKLKNLDQLLQHVARFEVAGASCAEVEAQPS